MATAKKCDRCHKLYNPYPEKGNANNKESINGMMTCSISEKRSYYDIDLIDLCPECLVELGEWLNKKEEFIRIPVKERKILSKQELKRIDAMTSVMDKNETIVED